MSDVSLDEKEIRSYLLGSLPPAATERFDELSFTDDIFAEALIAAENDLVDAYVNGDLSSRDRKLFEGRYTISPSRRSKIRFAESLKEYGAKTAPVERTLKETTSVFSATYRFLRWGLAAAATAVVFFAVWWFFPRVGPAEDRAGAAASPIEAENANRNVTPGSNSQVNAPELATAENGTPVEPSDDPAANDLPSNDRKPPMKRPEAARVFAFSLAPQLRSGSRVPEIPVPEGTGRAAVRLELEPFDFKSYQITLFDPSNRQIWRSGTIRPTGPALRQSVIANVPARLLQAGVHNFTVAGVKASAPPEIVGDYPFKVVR